MNKKRNYITNSAEQTKNLGSTTAKDILREDYSQNTAFVLGLRGNLGSGKTTFLQGFAKGLEIKEKILSPTFIIVKKYRIIAGAKNKKRRSLLGRTSGFEFFYHIDCYRLGKTKELAVLGFEEIVSNPKNIIAVEWAEKAREFLPQNTMWLDFKFINEKKRKIAFLNI